MTNPVRLVFEHMPSLTDADDELITLARFDIEADNAELAKRTCACGERLDGFDEYNFHLQEVMEAAIS